MKPIKKFLPLSCPSCASPLKVTSLACEACDTTVSGSFELPLLARLPADDLQFVIDFVKSSGSLKVMAQQLGLSYPTVRNRLDDIIANIETIEKNIKASR
ncbi:DUF2089 domain-containing protein [Chitinophaga oryzae]|uniref:DUF2089 domain-containing protein n=1 Tax=Chitinophaga oryzae TaxID=2725414 RepID=A0ABX6LHI5_9BACT|nr:DUF2089 family protein [Chitinophaga oryzae]QJB39571.1 DUF2089 domain-containing protein [Chitinophaga oryzae]